MSNARPYFLSICVKVFTTTPRGSRALARSGYCRLSCWILYSLSSRLVRGLCSPKIIRTSSVPGEHLPLKNQLQCLRIEYGSEVRLEALCRKHLVGCIITPHFILATIIGDCEIGKGKLILMAFLAHNGDRSAALRNSLCGVQHCTYSPVQITLLPGCIGKSGCLKISLADFTNTVN